MQCPRVHATRAVRGPGTAWAEHLVCTRTADRQAQHTHSTCTAPAHFRDAVLVHWPCQHSNSSACVVRGGEHSPCTSLRTCVTPALLPPAVVGGVGCEASHPNRLRTSPGRETVHHMPIVVRFFLPTSAVPALCICDGIQRVGGEDGVFFPSVGDSAGVVGFVTSPYRFLKKTTRAPSLNPSPIPSTTSPLPPPPHESQ
jgi:hypothetical protein